MLREFLKYMRRFLWTILIAIPVLIFLLQIPRVNARLTELLLNHLLSSKEVHFKIQKTSGQYPFGTTFHKVDVYDKTGLCVKIDKMKLSWKGIDLLFGKINFDRITIKTLDLQRIPSKFLEADDDPILFPPLTIRRGTIKRLCIPMLYEGAMGIITAVFSNRQDEHFMDVFLTEPEGKVHPLQEPFVHYHQKGIDYECRLQLDKPVSYFRTLSPYKVDQIQSGDLFLKARFHGKTDFISILGDFTGTISKLKTTLPEVERLIGQEGRASFAISQDQDVLEIKDGLVQTEKGTKMTLTYKKSPFMGSYEHLMKMKFIVPECKDVIPYGIPLSGQAEGDVTYTARADHKKITAVLKNLTWQGAPATLKSLHLEGNKTVEGGQLEVKLVHTNFYADLKGKAVLLKDIPFYKAHLDIQGKGIHMTAEGEIPVDLSFQTFPAMAIEGAATDLQPLGAFLSRQMSGSCSLKANIHNQDFYGKLTAHNLFDPLLPGSLILKEVHLLTTLHKYQGPIRLNAQTSAGDVSLSLMMSPMKQENAYQILIQQLDYLYEGRKKAEHKSSKPIQLVFSLSGDKTISIPQLLVTLKGGGQLESQNIFASFGDETILRANASLKKLSASFFDDYIDEGKFQGTLNGKFNIQSLKLPKKSENSDSLKEDLKQKTQKPIESALSSADYSLQCSYQLDLSLNQFGLNDPYRKQVKVVSGSFRAVHTGTHLTWKGAFCGEQDLKGITHLTCSGACPTESILPEKGQSVQSSCEGCLDLSFLNGFFNTKDRYKGIATLNLHYKKGTLGGVFSLTNGYLENAEFGTILKDIDIKGNILSNQLKIVRMSATDLAKGKVTGKGGIHFENISEPLFNVHVNLDQVLAANTDKMILLVSGNMTLGNKHSASSSPQIQGKITVQSGLVDLNSEAPAPKNIRVYRVKKDLEYKQEKLANAFGPELNVDVHVPKKFFIQGQGLHSEWYGDLKVRGKATSPQIEGKLMSVKGHIDVADKRLILVDSHISFTTIHDKKGEHLTPVLYIKGKKVVGEYTAYVVVSGIATDPKIVFTSTPALSTEEVIFLILFNKPLKNASAAQGLQLATTLANIKAGSLSGGGFQSLNQLFGLDELGFSDDAKDDSSESAMPLSLRAGKQLTDKVYVGVDRNIHNENDIKAQMKIDLTENTKIDLETGTEESSVGYSWEKRY